MQSCKSDGNLLSLHHSVGSKGEAIDEFPLCDHGGREVTRGGGASRRLRRKRQGDRSVAPEGPRNLLVYGRDVASGSCCGVVVPPIVFAAKVPVWASECLGRSSAFSSPHVISIEVEPE